MRVQVECHIDDRSEQIPGRIDLDGRSVEIQEILDQWHGDDYRYFKLIGRDGNLYILRHDESQAQWDLTLFQSPRGAMFAERMASDIAKYGRRNVREKAS